MLEGWGQTRTPQTCCVACIAKRKWLSATQATNRLRHPALPLLGGEGIWLGIASVLLDQAAPTESNQRRRQGFAHQMRLGSGGPPAQFFRDPRQCARRAAIYTRAFSSCEPRYAEMIGEAAKLVLERIGMSDALYHSAEHTALVTLVGQDILRGERLRRRLSAEDR